MKVARHPTALGERRCRCYLPVLAEFTRLPMHGTWPARTVVSPLRCRNQILAKKTPPTAALHLTAPEEEEEAAVVRLLPEGAEGGLRAVSAVRRRESRNGPRVPSACGEGAQAVPAGTS